MDPNDPTPVADKELFPSAGRSKALPYANAGPFSSPFSANTVVLFVLAGNTIFTRDGLGQFAQTIRQNIAVLASTVDDCW